MTPAAFRLRLCVLLIALWAVGLRLFLLFAAPNTQEDFYITLRYAENIAAGNGFVYNPGERVLGTTTPLYTLLLALFLRAGLDAVFWGKLLNILAEGVSCLCVFRLGAAAGLPRAGLTAALCLAVAPVHLTWAGSGMESSLVAAVAAAAWALWAERREGGAWGCAALLALLRLDGIALAVVLLLATFWRERRIPWRGLAIYAALLLPWLLFAFAYFGSPVPNSLRAKLIVYAWDAPPGFPRLREFLTRMTDDPLALLLAAGAALFALRLLLARGSATSGLQRSGQSSPGQHRPGRGSPASNAGPASPGPGSPASIRPGLKTRTAGDKPPEGGYNANQLAPLSETERGGDAADKNNLAGGEVRRAKSEGNAPELDPSRTLLPPALWVCIHYGGMALSKVFLFGWYFVPPSPIYILVAMVGWHETLAAIGRRIGVSFPSESASVAASRRAALRAGVGALLTVAALSAITAPRVARSLRQAQAVEETLRIPIGRWLKEHAAPTDRVMLEPIGYIGYFSGLRVLDTVGLVSPEVLPFFRPGVASPYHELWTRLRPEWALLRAGEWESLRRYEARLPAYERLTSHYDLARSWSDRPQNESAVPSFLLFRRRQAGP